jgi:hypothetical protein
MHAFDPLLATGLSDRWTLVISGLRCSLVILSGIEVYPVLWL